MKEIPCFVSCHEPQNSLPSFFLEDTSSSEISVFNGVCLCFSSAANLSPCIRSLAGTDRRLHAADLFTLHSSSSHYSQWLQIHQGSTQNSGLSLLLDFISSPNVFPTFTRHPRGRTLNSALLHDLQNPSFEYAILWLSSPQSPAHFFWYSCDNNSLYHQSFHLTEFLTLLISHYSSVSSIFTPSNSTLTLICQL